jgi:hypothetical protein
MGLTFQIEEEKLELFHVVGKFLYNKRLIKGKPTFIPDQTIYEERPPLYFSPEDILNSTIEDN